MRSVSGSLWMSLLVMLATMTTGRPAAAQEEVLSVEPIGRVRLFTPYLLAADEEGRVVWYQSIDPGAAPPAAVQVLRPGQATWETTNLTPQRVASHLGVEPDAGAAGRFTSLAVAPGTGEAGDYRIYFAWRGHVAGRTRIVVGRWQARTDQVDVVADSAMITDAAEIGASPVLLEVRVHISGGQLLTVVRDFDRARVFSRPLGDSGLGRSIDFDEAAVRLHRDHLVLTPDATGGLLVTDLVDGLVWLIASDGTTRRVADFAGLPHVLSNVAPLNVSDAGALERVITFAANTAPRPGASWRSPFPAGVLFVPDQPATPSRIIGREELVNEQGLSLYMLSLEHLVPAGPESVVGVDPVTGRIIRLRMAVETD